MHPLGAADSSEELGSTSPIPSPTTEHLPTETAQPAQRADLGSAPPSRQGLDQIHPGTYYRQLAEDLYLLLAKNNLHALTEEERNLLHTKLEELRRFRASLGRGGTQSRTNMHQAPPSASSSASTPSTTYTSPPSSTGIPPHRPRKVARRAKNYLQRNPSYYVATTRGGEAPTRVHNFLSAHSNHPAPSPHTYPTMPAIPRSPAIVDGVVQQHYGYGRYEEGHHPTMTSHFPPSSSIRGTSLTKHLQADAAAEAGQAEYNHRLQHERDHQRSVQQQYHQYMQMPRDIAFPQQVAHYQHFADEGDVVLTTTTTTTTTTNTVTTTVGSPASSFLPFASGVAWSTMEMPRGGFQSRTDPIHYHLVSASSPAYPNNYLPLTDGWATSAPSCNGYRN